jgi:XTP/dITP diphosphohydrolase
MRRVLLGTWNPSKQEGLRKLLEGLPVEPVTPEQIGLAPIEVREDGWTFEDNAVHKARSLARAAGIPTIASDGGLEISALRGRWEGLKSRRFAGPGDEDRITALLAMMRDLPVQSRAARFHEAVALAEPDGRLVASAQCPGPIGRIAETADPRSRPGFWVPSVWLHPPRWVTEWDLTPDERSTLRTAWDAVGDALRPGLAAWAAGA